MEKTSSYIYQYMIIYMISINLATQCSDGGTIILFNNSLKYLEEDIGSLVINFSHLLSEPSLFSSCCLHLLFMAMTRIRILFHDLNEESLMQGLFIYSILGKFQEQRKDTEALRDLQ